MFSRIAYIKTKGDTLNVRSEPNGLIVSTFDNGSIVNMLIRPVNAGGYDWVPVEQGWVADEFVTEATVLYQVERIIDPSVLGSNSVGTIAFKIEVDGKMLKFIQLSTPPGIKHDEFSSLSDTDLVQQSINLFNQYWDRYKDKPTS